MKDDPSYPVQNFSLTGFAAVPRQVAARGSTQNILFVVVLAVMCLGHWRGTQVSPAAVGFSPHASMNVTEGCGVDACEPILCT